MTIRLSTSQINKLGINGILDVQRSVATTQQKIASGRRILTPGDDPVASTRILQLTQDLKLNTLYNANAATAQNRLEREDIALTGISDLLQRAQELVIQSGNGALDKEQRRFVAVELRGVAESMAQIMNSRDANGEFLFAGLQASTTPFVKGADGQYQYQGDDGQRSIQLGVDSFIQANDSGHNVFVDLPGGEVSARVTGSASNRALPPVVVSNTNVFDQDKFTQFYPENAVIEFRPTSEVAPEGLNYRVVQASDGRILKGNTAYQSAQAIEFNGLSVNLSGQAVTGDSFTVTSTRKQTLLTTLESFARELDSLDDDGIGRERLGQRVDSTLTNLQSAQTRQLEVQASVGSRLNQIESARSNNADVRLATQASLSELQDLDFAEAVSQLTQESFVLEAAQASFARISGLSLFNFI